ncbi:MAG: cell division protein FtsX [Bacteroidetes bacterium MED-G13]|nr:cell division protein FtsX [Flavobacteriaceae bacterium]PDH47837.1 MAG: cell division protein FtsX [Bacteroidetes bacterium MED-G13]
MPSIKNKRLITSYFSIVIIMSIVLFLYSFFGLFLVSSDSIINKFKEDFTVSIYLKENVKNIEINQLKNELLMSNFIDKANYISKEEAVTIMKEEYGEEFIKSLGFNPLLGSIDINLKSNYVNSKKLDSISRFIMKKKYIDEIVYDRDFINMINNNIKKISFWIIPSIIFSLLITFLIINSSIRLSIYAKRNIIKTMQLVGATRSFIRVPFIKTNLLLSLISSTIAIISILILIDFFDSNINFYNYVELKTIFFLLGSVVILGFTISLVSTFFATQNILNIDTKKLDI